MERYDNSHLHFLFGVIIGEQGKYFSLLSSRASLPHSCRWETPVATWVPALMMDVAKMGDICPPAIPFLSPPQSRSRCRKFSLGTCLYFSGPHSYRSLGWALQTVTSPAPSGTFLSPASLPPYFFSLRFLGRKTRKRAGRVRVDSSSLTLLAPLSPLLGESLVQPEVVFTAAIPELSSAREPRPFALSLQPLA